jgi:hypothetical protein
MSITGIPLLFIGLVLILNAIALQGKVRARDAGLVSLCAGGLTLLAALYLSAAAQVVPATALLLVGCTCIWSGLNALKDVEDQRAFGYFCLLGAVLSLPCAGQAYLRDADVGWTAAWVSFGFLWFLSYLVRVAGNTRLRGLTIASNYLVGIETLALGWLYLYNILPFKALTRGV